MTGPGEFGTEATIARLRQALADEQARALALAERVRFYRDAVAEAAQLTGVSRWANEDLVSWLRRGMRAAGEVMPADVRARIRMIESGPAAQSIRGRRAGASRPRVSSIRADIPHVWDVDGVPQGVRHELELDGETLVVRDVMLDEHGNPKPGAHERRALFIDVVHALLNMNDHEIRVAALRLVSGTGSDPEVR